MRSCFSDNWFAHAHEKSVTAADRSAETYRSQLDNSGVIQAVSDTLMRHVIHYALNTRGEITC
jgi:hypothetical protein